MTVETIPILPSRSFDDTVAFWSLLGFEESGRWPESYLIVNHPAGIELHFFWSTRLSVRSNDHGAYVRFDTAGAVDELHSSWVGLDLGEGKITEPHNTDYGLREFAVLDPMRNLIRVGGFLLASGRSAPASVGVDPSASYGRAADRRTSPNPARDGKRPPWSGSHETRCRRARPHR